MEIIKEAKSLRFQFKKRHCFNGEQQVIELKGIILVKVAEM